MLAQHVHRGERLERRHVSRAGHHDVGLASLVVARPPPDSEPRGAVFDGRVHIEPLRGRLLARDDHVDVMAAAQAVIGDGQQRIRIGRQVDANHVGLLVDHVIDETGVLMAEAVLVLPPHVGGEQVVEGGDRAPPGEPARDLEPLRVLVEHRIDDVDERFIAGEEAVASGKEITFKPALAQVLAQHLHDAAIGGELGVGGTEITHEYAVGDFEQVAKPVRFRFVGTEDAEIALGQVELHHIAQEGAGDSRRFGGR